MNEYPPGEYISYAKQSLPTPGPDLPPQTVLVNAGPLWGAFWITFAAKRNPRQGMRHYWFWTMESGERIERIGHPAPGGVVDFVLCHKTDAGTVGQPAVSSDQPKPHPESALRITTLITALERIKAEHGNLTVAEEKPLGFMAVQHLETQQVPQHRLSWAFQTARWWY
jgi:hypothetical protein